MEIFPNNMTFIRGVLYQGAAYLNLLLVNERNFQNYDNLNLNKYKKKKIKINWVKWFTIDPAY